MRIRHLVVLVVALTPSIAGQEEPLPAVTALVRPPLAALAVEPMIERAAPTLGDAARANDYPTFRELFEKTRPALWAPLHELWTYSINDPLGAFYGPEMRDRFERLYPGFAAYIEEHRIVDDYGNAYYPTSETRAFLLARAEAGVSAAGIGPPLRETIVEHRQRREERAERDTSITPSPAAAVDHAAADALPPVPAPAPLADSVRTSAGAAYSEAESRAPEPVPVTAVAPVPVETAVAAAGNGNAGRGLLLVIVGLIGIGLLALIMRAPGETAVITPRRDP